MAASSPEDPAKVGLAVDCPYCSHTLSTRTTSMAAPSPEDPAKVGLAVDCSYCIHTLSTRATSMTPPRARGSSQGRVSCGISCGLLPKIIISHLHIAIHPHSLGEAICSKMMSTTRYLHQSSIIQLSLAWAVVLLIC